MKEEIVKEIYRRYDLMRLNVPLIKQLNYGMTGSLVFFSRGLCLMGVFQDDKEDWMDTEYIKEIIDYDNSTYDGLINALFTSMIRELENSGQLETLQ